MKIEHKVSTLGIATNIADMLSSREELIEVSQGERHAYVFLPRVNHDPAKDVDPLLTLSDSSGEVSAQIPGIFNRTYFKLVLGRRVELDYDFWKRTLWVHRMIILSNTFKRLPEEDVFELVDVFNLPRNKQSPNYSQEQILAGLRGLAGI